MSKAPVIKYMARQGDVLIMAAGNAVCGSEIPRDGGRVVLAYGELTGHAHAISAKAAHLHRSTNEPTDEQLTALGERILLVGRGGAALEHEEHATVRVPAGSYVVRTQREYHPVALRQVAD